MKRIALLLVPLFFATGISQEVPARELAVSADDLVPVELASVGVEPMTGTPVVLLREPEAGAIVPIFIGPGEARAILMAQRGIEVERPMTHDLAASIITSLEATLDRVIVDELKNNTYHGALELGIVDTEGAEGIIRIDSRPSDGLALAVRTGAAILVAPAILEAGEDIPFRGLDDEEDVVTALGITVMAASEDLREALDLPDREGVVVTATRSVAALSGLQAGALIVAVNEEEVSTPMAFLEAVSAAGEDDTATLTYWHDGETHELELSTDVPDRAPEERRRL